MPVENAFGILAPHWRIFDRKMPLDPTNVDFVVQACVCLHNMLTPDKELHEIAAQLNPNNIPYLEDDGLIRYLPRLNGYHAGQDMTFSEDTSIAQKAPPHGNTEECPTDCKHFCIIFMKDALLIFCRNVVILCRRLTL